MPHKTERCCHKGGLTTKFSRLIAGALSAAMALSGTVTSFSRNAAAESLFVGDVNNDGQINAMDCSLILESYSSTSRGFSSQLTETMKRAADVNRDGRIDSIDASMAMAYESYISTGGTGEIDEFIAEKYKDMQTVTFGEYGGFTYAEIESSPVKPEITIEVENTENGIVVDSDSFAGKRYNCTVKVKGASGKYSSTGIHLYYDARLILDKDDLRTFGKFGEAVSDLKGMAESDYSAPKNGMKSIFLCTAGAGNTGSDGEYFTFSFKLPEDTAAGTVFPFDVHFEDGDLFLNNNADREGGLMQAYTFTKGIKNWINPINISESDIKRCIALSYMDRGCDGYIAVADSSQPSVTTTPPASTAELLPAPITGESYAESDIADSQYYDRSLVTSDSPVKPELSITVDGADNGQVFDASDIAGKTIKCTLKISGAEKKYSATGIHVRFDKRLSIVEESDGSPAKKGEAINGLNEICNADKETDSMKGIFFSTFSLDNNGKDGDMWEFTLKVPDNAKSGEVYPIDIIYVISENAEDMFFDSEFQKDGKLMNAYTFMYGIYNQRYNCNFKADDDDVKECPALKNIAGYYDGYIAIAGELKNSGICGDVNLDGRVGIADAVAILQYLGNKDKYSLSEEAKENADVYNKGDGITGNDAVTIQYVDAGIIKESDLPVKGK